MDTQTEQVFAVAAKVLPKEMYETLALQAAQEVPRLDLHDISLSAWTVGKIKGYIAEHTTHGILGIYDIPEEQITHFLRNANIVQSVRHTISLFLFNKLPEFPCEITVKVKNDIPKVVTNYVESMTDYSLLDKKAIATTMVAIKSRHLFMYSWEGDGILKDAMDAAIEALEDDGMIAV